MVGTGESRRTGTDYCNTLACAVRGWTRLDASLCKSSLHNRKLILAHGHSLMLLVEHTSFLA